MDSGEDDLSIKLSDVSLLDCSICFNPLSIPIFQCSNGHVTCSSCHARLKNKCPTCSTTLGNSRNRALEKLLESLSLSCSYKPAGCSALLTYSSKRFHEETCAFAPYSCPFKYCFYSGSQPELYLHLNKQHARSVVQLKPDGTSGGKFLMTKADEFVVFLKEDAENEPGHGCIYVLDFKTMRIRCISDQDAVVKQRFTMAVQHKCGTFLFEPDMVTQANDGGDSAAKELIQFLDQFFDQDGLIWIRVLN